MFDSFFYVLLIGLAIFLPIAHPFTGMALMLGLFSSIDDEHQLRTAFKAAFYSFMIMLVAWLIGESLMTRLGIGLNTLSIAGGALLIIAGLRMLFPERKAGSDKNQVENIAFMPIALPGTAGPGVISIIVGFDAMLVERGYASSIPTGMATITVFFIISALLWLGLRFVDRIMAFLGNTRIAVISCLIGFVQFCVGTQFVISGVKGEFLFL